MIVVVYVFTVSSWHYVYYNFLSECLCLSLFCVCLFYNIDKTSKESFI